MISQYVNVKNTDAASLLIRMSLGIMWIAHALMKWFVFTIPGLAQWLGSMGLPSHMAWPLFLIELLGGVAILIGFYGKQASLILAPVIAGAAWVHLPNGWAHTSTGGGWEYPVFILVISIAHFMLGDGRYALKKD